MTEADKKKITAVEMMRCEGDALPVDALINNR